MKRVEGRKVVFVVGGEKSNKSPFLTSLLLKKPKVCSLEKMNRKLGCGGLKAQWRKAHLYRNGATACPGQDGRGSSGENEEPQRKNTQTLIPGGTQ